MVAFDVGDTGTVVRDGETGRIVPDGDIDALASAVADLLNDDERRIEAGRAARAFAANHFTAWDTRIDMEIEILRSISDR